MKITIVGGGPSGLYLAILIKRRRPDWPVVVLEQNQADATFGFGVVLADSGLAQIKAADPQVHEALIERMTFTGSQTIRLNGEAIDILHPAKGGAIARIDLLRVLQQAAQDSGVDIRFGQRVGDLRELAELGLADADIVVGADGVNSVVRAAFEPQFGTTQSLLTNHFAWFGTKRVFKQSALVFRNYRGSAFVAHYYPYCATGSTFVAECDHASWLNLGLEQMDNIQRQALIESIFAAELEGESLISNNSNWRQFPVLTSPNWIAGKHVLIGDAQTSAHFSIGSGTRIAMEDSIALADALTDESSAQDEREGGLQRLQHFVAVRGPEKTKLLSASRKSYLWYEDIGKWMQQYSLHGFVYAFMTRTGRMGDERLEQQYPELLAQLREAGALPGNKPSSSSSRQTA